MAAKMMAVKDVTPGSVLADSVLSIKGKVLLGKNIILTPRHISLLEAWDVQSVFIQGDEEESPAEPAETAVPAEESGEYVQFSQKYDSIVANTDQTFTIIRKRRIIPVVHLKKTAGDIRSSIVANSFKIMNYLLANDCRLADFISRHSVSVAYFAGIIARQMKWKEEDVEGVALAGLLHDVGNLTAADVHDFRAQANIAEAARLLRTTTGLSSEVILGIIQHRESVNSTGRVAGEHGSKIHPYAKVIAVADYFHNMAYKDTCANPFPVLDLLAAKMFSSLDPDVCQLFISRVRDSLLNNKVLLSDGQEAELIFFNPNKYSLPVVKTADNRIVDLSRCNDLKIQQLASPKIERGADK
ncbi:MAG: HD domain-containing protein [Veillonellales bacterium]